MKSFPFPEASAGDLGIDAAALKDIATTAATQRPWLDSLLIVRHNKLAFEAHFNGQNGNQLHDLYSVTKQWLSCLVGIALENGVLASLDEPVFEAHAGRIDGAFDPTKRDITLRHCLAMQSGLRFDNTLEAAFAFASSADPVTFAFSEAVELQHAPGTHWNYNAIDAQLVAETLHARAGRSLTELSRDWLAGPLGIESFEWPRAIALPGAATWPAEIGASELRLCPHDFTRFGAMLLGLGQSDETMIVPRGWIELATTSSPGVDGAFINRFYQSIGAPAVPGHHGYGLHMGTMQFHGHLSITAAGTGGQYAWAIPDLELLVVQTASVAPEDPQAGLSGGALMMRDHIIPAIKA